MSETDHDGWTALHHAAFRGHGPVVSLLLRRGGDVAIRTQTFCTPLHVACVAAQRETIALLVLAGSQLDFNAPFQTPISMLPTPPAPTEFEEGRVFEYSDVGQALWRLQQAGQLTDAHLTTSAGFALPVHRAVLAAMGAEALADDPALTARVDAAQLGALVSLLYTGYVGEALMQGSFAPRETLERDTQLLVHVLRGSRLVGLPQFGRIVQRSVVSRIGRGGAATPDGFNPDLELLARVTPHADLFDADFRVLLGFFVLNNFSTLLRYHDARSHMGHLSIDRTAMVRAMVAVLPCEAKKLEVRPSRWRHWGVPPVDSSTREALAALVGAIRSDKLAGWFVYPVSAIDYTAPDPFTARSVLVDYWPITQFPMNLETVSNRLEGNFYVSPEECVNDLRLIFCNAMRYNDEGSEIFQHACALYFMTGQLYNKSIGQLHVPVQPIERGTVDDFVDVNSQRIMSLVQDAFARGQAPNPTELSYDPTAPGPAAPPRGKKTGKAKTGSNTAKRQRKELRESDWRPLPPNGGGGGGGGGTSPAPQAKKKQASKKAKPVKTPPTPRAQAHYAAQQHHYQQGAPAQHRPVAQPRDHLPPPPMAVPDIGAGRFKQEAPPVSFEEKTRLGEDIQRLQEHQIPGLFQIIQARGQAKIGTDDEEVELDLNGMSAETLGEVRNYVDSCILHSK